ncbi:MAG: c-type cytochrome [Planctomycetes bacterium]|nr:c-type cytochrome [Planctomycetota bacterium]
MQRARSQSALVSLLVLAAAESATPETLESRLLARDPGALAREARERGDPARGAIVFHQPQLGCVKCHEAEDGGPPLGPDLAQPIREAGAARDAHIVESVLAPSKAVREGYEAVTVVIRDGRTITGRVLEERPAALVLREASGAGEVVTVPKDDVLGRERGAESLMPSGLVSQLSSEQELLDLARYLLEIAEVGPERARELRPPPSFFAPPPLPEYEGDIDHAGMIRSLDGKSLARGRRIYERQCANCHGTHDEPGSLPTSLRFASGKFKNGSDPHGMYRTITRGFGMMTPQTWMVPRQKYDVIHYIREAYVRERNPSQYAPADEAYLDRLQKGTSRGPEPSDVEEWSAMDYGPTLVNTYEVGSDGSNFAHKGIAVRLDPGPGGVSRGRHWIVFDHDTLRAAAGWSGDGFIDWNGIHFNGRHEVHPRIAGDVSFANRTGPGWASPLDGSLDDPRLRGRDGRAYGPLPRSWGRYRGLYHYGGKAVIAYTVGETPVLEMPGLEEAAGLPVFTRTFNLGPRPKGLTLVVAGPPAAGVWPEQRKAEPASGRHVTAGIGPAIPGAVWTGGHGSPLRLEVPAGGEALRFTLAIARVEGPEEAAALRARCRERAPAMDLAPLTRGGPPRWAATLAARPALGGDAGPFAADALSHPAATPWACRLRFTGLDFLPGGRSLAVSSWDGDVWRVEGIDAPERGLTWRRIASGLFQPLGLKVAGGRIHVACRDQIAVLHDLDGDGETDFYEPFNSDHQVTEHFHEFAMGLETDAEGNFYYAKSARHARTALVPHHGTLLRVARDGSRTEIVATGFRAANGVCVNPDGTFLVTDQEGHWMPKSRINWVREGGFYGNMFGYHGVTDSSDGAMEPPLCWITNAFDRSPAELLRVPQGAWGPLGGSLLSLSYGYGKIFIVPHEKLGGQAQGGLCELPIPQFPTGVMRGRFHPESRDLYLCGMYAWAGAQTQPGGLYRLRFTGKPVWLPVELRARRGRLEIAFSGPLDPGTASEASRYATKTWSLRRTANYGSDHHDEKPLAVAGARLAADGRTVVLEVPEIAPAWCLELRYSLRGAGGEPVRGTIPGTVHRLGE